MDATAAARLLDSTRLHAAISQRPPKIKCTCSCLSSSLSLPTEILAKLLLPLLLLLLPLLLQHIISAMCGQATAKRQLPMPLPRHTYAPEAIQSDHNPPNHSPTDPNPDAMQSVFVSFRFVSCLRYKLKSPM